MMVDAATATVATQATAQPISIWFLYACSVSGALLLWAKATLHKKKIFGFGDIAQRLFPNWEAAQYLFQFVTFVLFGGFIAMVVTGPVTVVQAVTGGVAWSRIASKD